MTHKLYLIILGETNETEVIAPWSNEIRIQGNVTTTIKEQ
jgi:hypothetical protein